MTTQFELALNYHSRRSDFAAILNQWNTESVGSLDTSDVTLVYEDVKEFEAHKLLK